MKKPYNDGTEYLLFSPEELLEELAALVPIPRVHLMRFHGCLAPHAKIREKVVPPRESAEESKPCRKRMTWALCSSECSRLRSISAGVVAESSRSSPLSSSRHRRIVDLVQETFSPFVLEVWRGNFISAILFSCPHLRLIQNRKTELSTYAK
jgi:hypothetical protein